MGNQLLKNYEVEPTVLQDLGLWKLHAACAFEAKSKRVSAFVFKKKLLKGKNIPNPMKEEIHAVLRKEAQVLARVKHPCLLNIVEPLVEHKKCLVFATEPLVGSLESLIRQGRLGEVYTSDLEFRMHVLELIEGLNFLHSSAKLAHLNLSPSSIYLTESGKWKISGLTFSFPIPSDAKDRNFKSNDACLKDFPQIFHPNLRFSAPELFPFSNSARTHPAADIFSLGMMLVFLLSAVDDEKTLFLDTEGLTPDTHAQKIREFIAKIENFGFFKAGSQGFKLILLRMLSFSAESRASIMDLKASPWLNDPLLQTLGYMDSLEQRDESQQTAFFKGFLKIAVKFEGSILKRKILPRVCDFLTKDHCCSVALEVIFTSVEPGGFSKEEFMVIVWPGIKKLAQMKEISAQALFIMANNIKKIGDYIPKNEFQTLLLPLFLKCFDCGVGKLEAAVLGCTDFMAQKLELSVMKGKVLPKMLKLCGDEKMETRKNAAFALMKVYSTFDRNTINEQILPIVEKAARRSDDPSLLFGLLEMYEGVARVLPLDGIVLRVIPQLILPFSEKTIQREEFLKRFEIVQSLLKRVYDEKIKSFDALEEGIRMEKQKMEQVMKDIEEIDEKKLENNEVAPEKQEESQTNEDFDFLKILGKKRSFEASNPDLPRGNMTSTKKEGLNNETQIRNEIENTSSLTKNQGSINSFDTSQIQSANQFFDITKINNIATSNNNSNNAFEIARMSQNVPINNNDLLNNMNMAFVLTPVKKEQFKDDNEGKDKISSSLKREDFANIATMNFKPSQIKTGNNSLVSPEQRNFSSLVFSNQIESSKQGWFGSEEKKSSNPFEEMLTVINDGSKKTEKTEEGAFDFVDNLMNKKKTAENPFSGFNGVQFTPQKDC